MQSGLTALHLAAQEDKVCVAEILAKNGANLDQQTKVECALSLNIQLLCHKMFLASSTEGFSKWTVYFFIYLCVNGCLVLHIVPAW